MGAGSKIPGEGIVWICLSSEEIVRWTDLCCEGAGCEQDVASRKDGCGERNQAAGVHQASQCGEGQGENPPKPTQERNLSSYVHDIQAIDAVT